LLTGCYLKVLIAKDIENETTMPIVSSNADPQNSFLFTISFFIFISGLRSTNGLSLSKFKFRAAGLGAYDNHSQHLGPPNEPLSPRAMA